MKFFPGQRVRWRSSQSDHVFTGTVVRALQSDCYLVRDSTGKTPRVIHDSRLGAIPKPQCKEVFA